MRIVRLMRKLSPLLSCVFACAAAIVVWALAALTLGVAAAVICQDDTSVAAAQMRAVAIPVSAIPAAAAWWLAARGLRRWLDTKTKSTPRSRIGV